MKVITKQSLINSAAARWKHQYYDGNKWTYLTKTGPHRRDTYMALKALKSDATEEDVIKITGNNSWTCLICSECGRDVDKLVEVGQKPDYNSNTAYLCVFCLLSAVTLIEK